MPLFLFCMGTHMKSHCCLCHETNVYTSVLDKATTAAASHFLTSNQPMGISFAWVHSTDFCQIHNCIIQLHSNMSLLEACMIAVSQSLNPLINQFAHPVFRTHHGSQQTITGKTMYPKH